MSDQTRPDTIEGSRATSDRNEQAVRAEIEKYEASGELVTGSAATLAGLWKSTLGALAPGALAEGVAKNLGLPGIQRFRNPEYAPPRLPNGSEASPLRRELARRGLPEAEVEALVGQWGVDLGGITGPRLAGLVADRLHRAALKAAAPSAPEARPTPSPAPTRAAGDTPTPAPRKRLGGI